MNKLEALKALFDGKKIRPSHWKNHYIFLKNNTIMSDELSNYTDYFFDDWWSDFLLYYEEYPLNAVAAVKAMLKGKKVNSSRHAYSPLSFDHDRGSFVDRDGDNTRLVDYDKYSLVD